MVSITRSMELDLWTLRSSTQHELTETCETKTIVDDRSFVKCQCLVALATC